jgi:uncharacterized protein YggU (UPF0235/DUF167 family)
VVGWRDDALRLRVTAAPEGGQANRAVSGLLAEALDIPVSRIALVRGAAGRDKLVRIEGLSLADIRARIPLTVPSPPGRS